MAIWMFAPAAPLPSPLDGGLFRAAVGVVLVLGTLALLSYLLRRGVLTLPGQRASRALSVETALSLGDRRSVVVLNVEGRRMLLGLTPTQISVLGELNTTQAAFSQAMERASNGTPACRAEASGEGGGASS